MAGNGQKKLATEDCVRVGDFIYFISKDINVVFKLEIETGIIEIVDSIPEEGILEKRLGSKIICWNNELIFAPMKAKKIWRYNIQTKIWRGIERKKLDNWSEQGDMFQAILYKDKCFFIGSVYPAIIALDLQNDSIEYIEEPYKKYKIIAADIKDAYFRTDYVQIDSKLYLASCITNDIMEFDFETYAYKYYTVGSPNNTYAGITYDGNYFYLAPRKCGPIVIWNGESDWKEIDLPKEIKDKDTFWFGGVVERKGEIVFFAYAGDKTIILQNRNDTKLKIIDEQYWFYKKIDETTYVSFDRDGKLRIYVDNNVYDYELTVKEKELENFLRNKRKSDINALLIEDQFVDLQLFINFL